MKILMIYDDISGGGGAERVICNLSNSFAVDGYDMMVFSLELRNICPYKYNPDVKINFIKTKTKPKGFVKILHEIKRLIMPIKEWNAREKRVHFKSIISQFNPDFIICHIHFDNNLAQMLHKMRDKTIKVIHCSFDAYEKWNIDLNVYKNIALLSAHDRDKFQAKYPNSNFYVIPNFLPSIADLNTNPAQKVVLSVGRLTDQKGFLRLIDIWNLVQNGGKFADWKLKIVGDGELKEQILAKIKELNLEGSVELKPFTTQIEKEYLSASIYAMSSHFEGLPMVLIEAASHALPCVAFDVATGPSDIIADGASGYLVADDDLQEYANKLQILMSDEGLRAQMGAKSKAIARDKFSKEVVLKQWLELFEKLKKSE